MRFLAAAFCPSCLDARALFCPPEPPQTRPHGPAATAECAARAEILCHSHCARPEGTETGVREAEQKRSRTGVGDGGGASRRSRGNKPRGCVFSSGGMLFPGGRGSAPAAPARLTLTRTASCE